MKILIVHGDDFGPLLIPKLAHHGFRVVAATCAQAALDTIRRIRIEAVVTDFRLQGRSGVWLLEQVRLIAPAMPRVLIANDDRVDLERLVGRGVCDQAFRAPVDPRRLQVTLRNLAIARNPRNAGEVAGVPSPIHNDYTPTIVM